MKAILSAAALFALVATGAAAMPRDQAEAAKLAANANAAAPPQPQGLLTYDQYVAMPLKERKAVVDIIAKVGASPNAKAQTKPWDWIKCEICKKAIGWFEGKAASVGCGLADSIAVSACEVAGLGPEDPLADVCAAAFIAGCEIVVKDAEEHITNHADVCKHIHMC